MWDRFRGGSARCKPVGASQAASQLSTVASAWRKRRRDAVALVSEADGLRLALDRHAEVGQPLGQ
jgi:hypothetical protein